MGPLWHYTCDHGRWAIGRVGLVYPAHHLTTRALPPTGRYAWFTDLSAPIRDALGLTQHLAQCDRTAHRYRVTDPAGIVPWTAVRRDFPPLWRVDLEWTSGARPKHWYVSEEPVPVELD